MKILARPMIEVNGYELIGIKGLSECQAPFFCPAWTYSFPDSAHEKAFLY